MSLPAYIYIVCTDANGVIGVDDALPWSCRLDMDRFRTLTRTPNGASALTHAVLMGYTTWASIPSQHRPLKDRVNVVLTRCSDHARDVRAAGGYPFTSLAMAQNFAESSGVSRVYVIGGYALYSHPDLLARVSVVHWTKLHFDCLGGHLPTSSSVTVFRVTDHFDFDEGEKTVESSQFEVLEEWTTCTACTLLPATSRDVDVTFTTLRRRSPGDTASARLSSIHTPASPHPPSTSFPRSGEAQYLDLLRRVLSDGAVRRTRNSVTRSVFGARLEIDLADGRVPLLTTKKMAWKTVLRELFWFVRGDTNNTSLQDVGVHIWDANASRAFLDSRGLTTRAENDLGPVYGFQWRHFGAAYETCTSDYTGKGVDQLEACRRLIIEDPTSRRMLFTAWNPSDLAGMALPPCHVLGQWYVSGAGEEEDEEDEEDEGAERRRMSIQSPRPNRNRPKGRLWLQVYQRSGDLFLGVPFNLFSYSALVHMMAHLTGTLPGGLVYVLGDAHIYASHTAAVSTQLARPVHAPPRFGVVPGCQVNAWEEFQLETFALKEYVCEKGLRAEMVA